MKPKPDWNIALYNHFGENNVFPLQKSKQFPQHEGNQEFSEVIEHKKS
jgi:hypothetical protein